MEQSSQLIQQQLFNRQLGVQKAIADSYKETTVQLRKREIDLEKVVEELLSILEQSRGQFIPQEQARLQAEIDSQNYVNQIMKYRSIIREAQGVIHDYKKRDSQCSDNSTSVVPLASNISVEQEPLSTEALKIPSAQNEVLSEDVKDLNIMVDEPSLTQSTLTDHVNTEEPSQPSPIVDLAATSIETTTTTLDSGDNILDVLTKLELILNNSPSENSLDCSRKSMSKLSSRISLPVKFKAKPTHVNSVVGEVFLSKRQRKLQRKRMLAGVANLAQLSNGGATNMGNNTATVNQGSVFSRISSGIL